MQQITNIYIFSYNDISCNKNNLKRVQQLTENHYQQPKLQLATTIRTKTTTRNRTVAASTITVLNSYNEEQQQQQDIQKNNCLQPLTEKYL